MAADLSGRTVLLVEDEYLIASELGTALRRSGATVLGPARDLDAARTALSTETPDAAVLDVKLHSDFVYALADDLMRSGVPIVFATRFDCAVLPERFRSVSCYEKPVSIRSLIRTVEHLIGARSGGSQASQQASNGVADRPN